MGILRYLGDDDGDDDEDDDDGCDGRVVEGMQKPYVGHGRGHENDCGYGLQYKSCLMNTNTKTRK